MNITEVKTSYEYVTELCERLENSLKLDQEELQKSQKRYKKHYTGLMESHVGAKDYRVKMGSKTKKYHMNMLKKLEVNVVPTSNEGWCYRAVPRVIPVHQNIDPELGEVPDLKGFRQKER